MIEVVLAGDREKVAPENRFPMEFGSGQPLYHQVRTYDALVDNGIVLNSYNTGTGKTRAALLHLLRQREGRRFNTLFIAPTNELLRQHAGDVRTFVERNGLDVDVLTVDAQIVRELREPTLLERQGSRLHALLENPSLADGARGRSSYVLIINPDIFYYALYCRYGRLDWRNLFKDFVGKFDYVIVDELHYYNAKQLANFLFFLVVVKAYGFFDCDGRVCILTATPNPEVQRYFQRLVVPTAYIDRGTESPESAGLPTVPSLAPARLCLIPFSDLPTGSGLETVVARDVGDIERMMHAGEQGAVISSALWRINRISHRLQSTGVGQRCGRITGPEDRQGRQKAANKDLILASPTVDLGYNFVRLDDTKPRQNIDFLYLDARYSDDLLQRLGRAGRVLGKPQTDVPSSVVAVCPDALVTALRADGRSELTRPELAAMVREALPPRHDLYGYITSGAIGEAFLPVFRLRQMTDRTDAERLQRLFENVRDVLAPNSKRTYKRLTGEIVGFLERERQFSDWPQTLSAQVDRVFDSFVKANGGSSYSRDQRAAVRNDIVHRAGQLRRLFSAWLEQERATFEVRRAQYSFRDSVQGPEALVYDPQALLSSQPVRSHDLFHIVTNYDVHWYADEKEWHGHTGQQAPRDADVVAYGEIRGFRPVEERLRLRYEYDSGETREDWQRRFEWGPTALQGIRVVAENSPLPRVVVSALSDHYVVCYACEPSAVGGGALINLGRHGDVRVDRMTVRFVDGTEAEHVVALGTAAFFAYAELRWVAFQRGRDDTPIFA